MEFRKGPRFISTSIPVSASFFRHENMRSFLVAAAAFVATVVARSVPLDAAPVLSARQNNLPSSFKWSSTDGLIFPKQDSHQVAAIKDPSIIEVNGVYHVFASTAKSEGYNLVYFNFTDFSKANQAPFYYLDQSPIGVGYRAAPEVCTYDHSTPIPTFSSENGNKP